MAKAFVPSKPSSLLNLVRCSSEPGECRPYVCAGLRGYDFQLILPVHQHKQCPVFVTKDASTLWPVPVEAGSIEERGIRLEQPTVSNKLGLLSVTQLDLCRTYLYKIS